MEIHASSTAAPGSIDATLVIPSDSHHSAEGVRRAVHLVEGSGPSISCETRDLLRSRLRAASLMLLLGFVVFLVWNGINLDLTQPRYLALLISHGVVTLALAGCAMSLCRRCQISTSVLWITETIIFGLPALYFLQMQYLSMTRCAEENQVLPSVSAVWLVLMFTYALFIPNTSRRAGVVFAAIAVIPVALSVLLTMWHAECSAASNAGLAYHSQLALILTVSAVVSTVGVRTIGNLRREAFEAKQLGQYRLRELIGRGGMGEVYLAEHQLMKRRCAIKLIRPEKAGDPNVLARFEREVRATAKLSHWNSIEIFDYGRTDDGTFYYVMEFLPGMNLQQLVERFGPLPAERVIHLLRQTCDALAEAHQAGLMHRDIKPANIFAAQRGGVYDVAKLLDFGLAKPLAETPDMQLSQEGMLAGSPLYMSPEQALGEEDPDHRSDIYALGAVAYFLLTGRPPFEDAKPLKVLMAHAQQEPAFLAEQDPAVPDDLEQVVLRCLAKRREDRYQSVVELSEALSACAAAGRWDARSARQWWSANGDRTAEDVKDQPTAELVEL